MMRKVLDGTKVQDSRLLVISIQTAKMIEGTN